MKRFLIGRDKTDIFIPFLHPNIIFTRYPYICNINLEIINALAVYAQTSNLVPL